MQHEGPTVSLRDINSEGKMHITIMHEPMIGCKVMQAVTLYQSDFRNPEFKDNEYVNSNLRAYTPRTRALQPR